MHDTHCATRADNATGAPMALEPQASSPIMSSTIRQ